MALTSTTLSAALTKTQTSFTVTSATGFAAGYLLRVDDEFLLISGVVGTQIEAQRGYLGTDAIAHGILSIAVAGPAKDFATVTPARMYTYGVSGALTAKQGYHRLMKAGVGAMTLTAPTADQEGDKMLVVSGTAQAHTITLGSGYFNAATNNVCTYGGAIGDFVELQAMNGSWNVLGYKNITLSAA